MKLSTLGLSAALVVPCAGSLAMPLSDARDPAGEVVAYLHAACEAYRRNDAAAIDSLIADDYTLTNSRGEITTKSDDLKAARAEETRYSEFRNVDMRPRVYGNTVVVTGRTLIKGKARDGTPFDLALRFTDTVVRLDGRWRLVASHVSRLPSDQR